MVMPLRSTVRAVNVAADLPPMPDEAGTKDGQRFDPSEDVWRLRKKAEGGGVLKLDWTKLENLSPRMVHLAKVIIASRASSYAAASLYNEFHTLKSLGKWTTLRPLEWSDISLDLGRAWLVHGETTPNMGNDFARLRALYEYGATVLQHTDFDPAIYLALSSLRAKGNAKGAAVRAADPEKGHLTPPELEMIERAIARYVGNERDRALVWLAMETGRNGLQYSLLKEADLTRVPAGGHDDGLWIYTVHFTRIKKRQEQMEIGHEALERLARVRMPINRDLGDLLWDIRMRTPTGPLLWWIDQNSPETDIYVRMNRWAREAELVSPRTGQSLVLGARRFRVTLATQAADQGASMEHIAALLDHEDLQNVKVYIDRSPRFLERIEEEIDDIYDPMIRRFRGEFATPDEAARRNLPVIPGVATHVMLDVGGIGACGHKSLCKLAPPLTCYSCENFVAFRNGPHADVVATLERAMEDMDQRIALQLAPVLAAARQVVQAVAQ